MIWNTWTDIDSSAYMRIEYIRMAYENQLYIADLLQQNMLTAPINLNYIDTSLGIASIPYSQYINLVENNLGILFNYTPWKFLNKVYIHWQGEYRDTRLFSFLDVNRWFNSLAYMKQAIEFIANHRRMCFAT